MRGATSVYGADNAIVFVSIHAPMRGATIFGVLEGFSALTVSIHAPMRGATAK